MDNVILIDDRCDFANQILLGKKTSEIMCCEDKKPFFKTVKPEQSIFFKKKSDPIKLKAIINDIQIFFDLNQETAKEIFEAYSEKCCFCKDIEEEFIERLSNSKYAFLVNFEQPSIVRPFDIDQEINDYWVCVDDIETIKST